jgi:hypothetical protein
MNITLPAPASAAPTAASTDRLTSAEQAATDPAERHKHERTFEEQLDEMAVALAATTTPELAAPSEVSRPATPATAQSVATEIERVGPTPGTNGPRPSDTVATTVSEVVRPEPIAPTAVTALGAPPTHVSVTADRDILRPLAPPMWTVDTAPIDAPAPSPAGTEGAPLGPPLEVATGPTTDAADRIDPAPPTVEPADAVEVELALDTVDAVEAVETDAPSSGDETTPPAIPIPTSSVRRDDSSAGTATGAAPLVAEPVDELASPLRLAPPRTIAVDLNDEGLGPLRVIATSEQRTIHVTVSAGEAVVRDALVRQQADLRHDLADAGLQLGSFDVDASGADRDHGDRAAMTNERDRHAARPAVVPTRGTPIHISHDGHRAAGRLDLRL